MEPISIAGATAQANCSVSRRGVIRGADCEAYLGSLREAADARNS